VFGSSSVQTARQVSRPKRPTAPCTLARMCKEAVDTPDDSSASYIAQLMVMAYRSATANHQCRRASQRAPGREGRRWCLKACRGISHILTLAALCFAWLLCIPRLCWNWSREGPMCSGRPLHATHHGTGSIGHDLPRLQAPLIRRPHLLRLVGQSMRLTAVLRARARALAPNGTGRSEAARSGEVVAQDATGCREDA
jgi:hypothetical protein